MEAEEGGGGSSLDGGGSGKADLRAEPRGNREPVPAEAEAAREVVHGAPASLLPPRRQQLPRETLRNPFLTLGVRLHEATRQTRGRSGTRPRPSSGASSGPLYMRFGFCLRLYTPTPASWALTPSCRSFVDQNVTQFLRLGWKLEVWAPLPVPTSRTLSPPHPTSRWSSPHPGSPRRFLPL